MMMRLPSESMLHIVPEPAKLIALEPDCVQLLPSELLHAGQLPVGVAGALRTRRPLLAIAQSPPDV
jgi:hypothetical protein